MPRTAFFGRVLESLAPQADTAKILLDEIEKASIRLLPGDIYLAGSPAAPKLSVQPDAIVESANVYCFVEAKRISGGSFQPEQLAREYLAVLQEANRSHRKPLLLLILSKVPPILIKRHGYLEIGDAVVIDDVGAWRGGNLAPVRVLEGDSMRQFAHRGHWLRLSMVRSDTLHQGDSTSGKPV